MKRLFALILIALTIIIISASSTEAQNQTFPKNFKGEFQAATLYTGVDRATGDTSKTFEVPYAVSQGIYYLQVDTATTGDTLKSMIIQGSPDGVHWYNTTTVFTDNGTSGSKQRVVATLLDKYLRFIFNVVGSAIKMDFNLKVIPKP